MHAARISRLLLVLTVAWFSTSVAKAGIELPGGAKIETVDFERHVMGMFGKTGCNSGSCHGSFQGKNGFRLSLFGYEPDRDHAALTRDIFGRRVDTVSPDDSLLLMKATGRTAHDGGMRFSQDSWQYNVFREWIAQGARWSKGSGEVKSLKVEPAEFVRCDPSKPVRVTVTAIFADGSSENITPFCDFKISDDAVASVSPLGVLTANKPGDTGMAINYRGHVQAVRVLVPSPMKKGFVYPNVQTVNYIDQQVFAKLRQMNMVPSDLANDTEFLRRIYLDTIGHLPQPEDIRAFVEDKSSDKRERKIEELLKHPLHSALWATKFSDITGNNTDLLPQPNQLKPKRSQMWHDWLRKRLADNMPYDELVRGIVVAKSRDGMSPEEWIEHLESVDGYADKGFVTGYEERETLDLFWLRQANVPIEQWGEKIAVAFLGVRLECAQCHKHPTDRWTQSDYRSFANIFAGVGTAGVSPEARKAITDLIAKRKEKLNGANANTLNTPREIFIVAQPRGLMTHPETNKPLPAKAIAGPEFAFRTGKDIRLELFDWMRSPENPFFARSFVNRVWAHYFGVGLVNPVDDFSMANPPSNPRLLDALAADFVKSGYNLRELERKILLSRTYQLASMPNETNRFDKVNYSHSYVRPMMAEVFVDTLNSALGTEENFGTDVPAGKKMIEIGASRIQNPTVGYALRIFGRPPRTAACDCERSMDPALPQTLYRMTDPTVLLKLQKSDRIAKLLKSKLTDEQIFEEMVLSTLSRFPTDNEKQAFSGFKKDSLSRQTLFVDVAWALINTREFILNH